MTWHNRFLLWAAVWFSMGIGVIIGRNGGTYGLVVTYGAMTAVALVAAFATSKST